MATKSKTIVLSLSATDCYELVKKLGNDSCFKENESNDEGIIWTAQNYTLETWITPVSKNKTEVEIIASSGALFDMFGHLDQHVKIFALQLKNRQDKAKKPESVLSEVDKKPIIEPPKPSEASTPLESEPSSKIYYVNNCLRQNYRELPESRSYSDPVFRKVLDPLNSGDNAVACREAE